MVCPYHGVVQNIFFVGKNILDLTSLIISYGIFIRPTCVFSVVCQEPVIKLECHFTIVVERPLVVSPYFSSTETPSLGT